MVRARLVERHTGSSSSNSLVKLFKTLAHECPNRKLTVARIVDELPALGFSPNLAGRDEMMAGIAGKT